MPLQSGIYYSYQASDRKGQAMTDREQRGFEIAESCRITRKDGVYSVPSQSGKGKYEVIADPVNPLCTCPDYETRGIRCKHIYAVQFSLEREESDDGTITETRTVTVTEKRTYTQNWPAYNAAQTTEKESFRLLLRGLCETIEEPHQTRGRPRLPMADAIFAACYKVYSTVSGRRFMTDLREAHGEGHISRCPCYNSIFNVLEAPETFDVLQSLVSLSAAPLQAVEENFACDSSGFSASKFDRWYEQKYGKTEKKSMRVWVKAHIMTGVKTNVVTAVEIHDQHANDCPHLPSLLDTTRQRFTVKEVSADLGYSSVNNLEAVEASGAFPLIPFKVNASIRKGGVWAKMWHYFTLQRDEFLHRYHLRSNVESTFSMIKRKFGDAVRSKTDIAMKNEVLAKFVCHNIVCLIHEMHETGIDPMFCPKSLLLAQKTRLN